MEIANDAVKALVNADKVDTPTGEIFFQACGKTYFLKAIAVRIFFIFRGNEV